MSMIGNLARVSDETIATIHADPSLVTTLLYSDIPPSTLSRPSFLGRLFGRGRSEKHSATPSIQPVPRADMLDIDKTWHAIHYLLTGTDWESGFPEGFLVSCGQVVGDVDVGYGPARSFSQSEVATIADYLAGLPNETLRSRLDFAEMQRLDIYPVVWEDESLIDDEWEYICGGLDDLRRFLAETKSKGMGLLVYIN